MNNFSSLKKAGLLSALILLIALGAQAQRDFRVNLTKHGQDVANLVPSDAWLVMTYELIPASSQVALFNRIKESLSREGLSQKIDEAINMACNSVPLMRDIHPYFISSVTLCIWGDPNKRASSGMTFFITISDHAAVQKALKEDAVLTTIDGVKLYCLPNSKELHFTLIGNYLVFATNKANLVRIARIYETPSKSLINSPAFKTAQASLPIESNMQLFLKTNIFNKFPNNTLKTPKQKRDFALALKCLNTCPWVAMSCAFQDTGYSMSLSVQLNSTILKSLNTLNAITPISLENVSYLPEGAISFVTISQPSKLWPLFIDPAEQYPELLKSMIMEIAKIEKETGLKFNEQFLPSFDGEMTVGIYPSDTKKVSPECIVILGSQNGANPAGSAQEYFKNIQSGRVQLQPGDRLALSTIQFDGETIYKLVETSTIKAIVSGKKRSRSVPATEEDVTYFYLPGNDVLVTSPSKRAIMRTIACNQQKIGSITQQPAFKNMLSQKSSNAQAFMMYDMSVIAQQAFNSPLTKIVNNAFNGACVVNVGYDGSMIEADMFVPFDWDQYIRSAKNLMSQFENRTNESSPPKTLPKKKKKK